MDWNGLEYGLEFGWSLDWSSGRQSVIAQTAELLCVLSHSVALMLVMVWYRT